MRPPKELIRITLADSIPDTPGIYILAYMGKVVYIGKAETSVFHRISEHRYSALHDRLGAWIVQCNDWTNIRLDVLIPPIDVPSINEWLYEAESACIRRFKPVLNIALV
jgi:hypothetical protein